MKKIIIILLVMLFGWFVPSNRTGELGKNYDLKVGDSVTILKYNIKLIDIMDNTCPPDATCIWQGEYSYKLDINDNEYTLGSVTKKEIELGVYKLKIVNAYKNKVIIRLEEKG